MLWVILLCDNIYAIPQIYISPEVAKVTPYNAALALNTYIATQNLSWARTNSILPWSNIQTYSFGIGSDVSYKWSTGLIFGSGIVNLSLRDMTWNSSFGNISIAPQHISPFNNYASEWTGMQDYSPYPYFLWWTRFWDEQWSRDDSRNALLFQFPSNTVWFGARFGDIESSSLWTLAELKLFDSWSNLITWVYLKNNYSEATCWGTTVQNSVSLCGNESTRYIWRSDAQTWTVKYMLLIVWDDDSGTNFSGQDYTWTWEHLSFIWPTLATTSYIPVILPAWTWNVNL